MRCERCWGNGFYMIAAREDGSTLTGFESSGIAKRQTCPDCNGTGITHCCDGLCEQPEREDN